jgi:predicted dehydrogenase
MNTRSSNRREFLHGAAAAGAALSALTVMDVAHAALSDDMIKVGVVGCGGRGTQAAENVLSSAEGVKIVALGDAFKDKADKAAKHLAEFAVKGKAKELGNSVDVPDDHCFGGLDAYEKVINSGANYIILATPPGFRPLHIPAVIAAGKNLFTEKPVGVDGTGIRKVLAAYEEAMKKGLYVGAGTQRRHQTGYLETMKQIHDGAIGDVAALRVYWNGHGIWFRPRTPEMNDVTYQLNNWYHFLWLCGDHIVEQHVHNLDVANWVMKGHPEKADGAGGRTPGNPSRKSGPPEEVGNIYDNFSIDYEYPGGVHTYSSCRHLPECTSNVSEAVVGTKGVADLHDGSWKINGKTVFSRQRNQAAISPYVQEHIDLIAHIRGGKPINELKTVAESTLTAIMGRMAAYTGKTVTWEKALNSKLNTFPDHLTWESSLPVDPVPAPGKTPLI